ncbi:MAG: hypothetical protein V2J07_04055 [Anaerolineae bacterium]|jgi:hypothetical protein|nr:hypothetical protein [Anaerolineae bacterium]
MMKDMITGKEISGEVKSIPYYQSVFTEATEGVTGVDSNTIIYHYQVQTEPLELIVDQETWLERVKWGKFWKVYFGILVVLLVLSVIMLTFEPDVHIVLMVGPFVVFFVMLLAEIIIHKNHKVNKGSQKKKLGTSGFISPEDFLVAKYRATLDVDPKITFFSEKEYQKLRKIEGNQ